MERLNPLPGPKSPGGEAGWASEDQNVAGHRGGRGSGVEVGDLHRAADHAIIVVPEGIGVVDDALAGVEGRAEIAGGEWLEKKGEGRIRGEAGEDGIIEPDLIILSPCLPVPL